MTAATPTAQLSRRRLGRSVFMTQLLLAGAMVLLVVMAEVAQPDMLADPVFFLGMVLIFLISGLAAVIPWDAVPKWVIATLPVLDIIGICMMRVSQPSLGVSYLLVFPVIWLATHFRLRGAVGGVVLSTVLIWAGAIFHNGVPDSSEIPRLAVVPIMLAFVSATTYATTRRAAAQKVLLTQQAGLFGSALRHSRRQEQTLDEIFNAVDFGVVAFDRAGAESVVNRAQREILARFGVPAGQSVPAVVYTEDRVTPFPDADRPFRRALNGESVDRVLVWLGEPGEARAAFLVSTRPITDENGAFDGGVMVSRDVTAELRAIQARDDLVASVSHELRTPLTSVLGYLELALDDDRLEPGTRSILGVASKNADRLLALVADLLTAASDAKGAMMLEFEPCDLSEIVADAIEAIRPVAAERDINFDIGALPPIVLDADAFRLRQVVDNLLSNAVKYNVQSGRIAVSLQATDASVELRVTDTGRGMTVDEQEKLFERFYRADSVRGSSVHGTGLGLSISRDIMRQHGGDLRLEIVPGHGACAIATLPARR
jgi:two-component system phosphate regulon sensor histidine kinase PhoR